MHLQSVANQYTMGQRETEAYQAELGGRYAPFEEVSREA
jgi:hypothetical protein